MDEEESAIGILKEIEDNASNEEIEHALYEFRGVLSKAVSRVGEGPLVSCYLLLRESPEYQTFALSLTHFIIEDVRACRHSLLKKVHDILQAKCIRQSEKQIPRLMLRCTLSAIANQLDHGQVEQFVTLTAEMHLKVHPDRFGSSQQMLKLFEMMEDRHLLDDKLTIVRDTLQLIGRPDVIEKIIDIYNPNKLIGITVTMDAKCVEDSQQPLCPALVSTLLDVANQRVLCSICENELCVDDEKTLKTLVLKHSTQIQQSLNFTALLPMLTNPQISFLTQDELSFVMKPHTDVQKANNLLQILTQKTISASRKFLVCLWLAREHLGHEDLFCRLWPSLPKTEVALIVDLCQQLQYASSLHPETPPAFTKLQGDLTRQSFRKVEGVLWDYFGKCEYQKLAKVTNRLNTSPSQEWSIVGKWFNAMNCVFVHHCKDHKYCIKNVLEPALQQCQHQSVLNRNILEGRIRLRLAQVYLMTGNKLKAVENSEKAHQLLSLTCGYDVAKLLLREAKVMSATQPHRRVEIESMYLAALHNYDEVHICCKPTAHLSLAAFYLYVSFGSIPKPESAVPVPSKEDIRKAKGQLEALNKLGLPLPSMRNCERNLLMAELLRLEGKLQEAYTAYSETAVESREAGLENLVTIAEHRCKVIKKEEQKSAFLDKLLLDISEKI